MSTVESAEAWARSVVQPHAADRAEPCMFSIYVASPNIIGPSGVAVEPSPMEGRIVEVSPEWILMRIEANGFFVCACDLVRAVPLVGSVVRITPYVRRGFDGLPLTRTLPEDGLPNTYHWNQNRVGAVVPRIPVDKGSFMTLFLSDLVSRIETLRASDGLRRLLQVLIDAGASHGPVCVTDPERHQLTEFLPALRFRVNCAKAVGWLDIIYDCGKDLHRLLLLDITGDVILKHMRGVNDQTMVKVIEEWIDDESSKLAEVEVLSPAPQRAAK